MNVMLSIKPEYCRQINNGRKKYEFRRKIFRRDTDIVYMYCTSPVKKVVGKFAIKTIIEDNPKKLWQNYNAFSGIKEIDFFKYFDGVERGFAIEIKAVYPLNPFDPKRLIPNFHSPRSFVYLDESIVDLKKTLEKTRISLKKAVALLNEIQLN